MDGPRILACARIAAFSAICAVSDVFVRASLIALRTFNVSGSGAKLDRATQGRHYGTNPPARAMSHQRSAAGRSAPRSDAFRNEPPTFVRGLRGWPGYVSRWGSCIRRSLPGAGGCRRRLGQYGRLAEVFHARSGRAKYQRSFFGCRSLLVCVAQVSDRSSSRDIRREFRQGNEPSIDELGRGPHFLAVLNQLFIRRIELGDSFAVDNTDFDPLLHLKRAQRPPTGLCAWLTIFFCFIGCFCP